MVLRREGARIIALLVLLIRVLVIALRTLTVAVDPGTGSVLLSVLLPSVHAFDTLIFYYVRYVNRYITILSSENVKILKHINPYMIM